MLPFYKGIVLAAYLKIAVIAAPQISFPLDQQIPPVAIVGEPFHFTFSPQTFASPHTLTYSLRDAPNWMSFDGDTRTLAGLPQINNTGDLKLSIQATDLEGSIALGLSLVVLATNPVNAALNIFQERLRHTGTVSSASTLSLHPQTAFKIELGSEVFGFNTQGLHYYAMSSDNTPLPAWLTFDTLNVAFTGTTPSLLTVQSSPETFQFRLRAGEVPGFWQAQLSFEISVTNHFLAFVEPAQHYNMTAGEQLFIPPLLPSLFRDGSILDSSLISNSSATQPEWLVLQPQDLSFSGIVPQGSQDVEFSLSVTDDQKNRAVLQISLSNQNRLENIPRQTYLPAVNVSRDQFFTYTFNSAKASVALQKLDKDPVEDASWLTFVSANSTVHGIVPRNAQPGFVNITLTIIENQRALEIIHLRVNVKIDGATAGLDQPTASTNSGISNTTSSPPRPNCSDDIEAAGRSKALALKIALPLCAVTIVLLIALIVAQKMRTARCRSIDDHAENMMNVMASTQTSLRQSSSGNIIIVGASSLSSSRSDLVPSSPSPRVDLAWPSHCRPLSQTFSLSSREDRQSPTTRSSWSSMLREFDGPAVYGYGKRQEQVQAMSRDAIYDDVNPEQPGSLGSQKSKPAIRNLALVRSKQTERSHARFNGRRTSGIGHGASFPESQAVTGQGMLRQVLSSPLSEDSMTRPTFGPTVNSRQQFGGNMPKKVLSTNRSRSLRLQSVASNESRYDDPQETSSISSHKGSGRQFNLERDCGTSWEDQDWQTESGSSIPNNKPTDSDGWSRCQEPVTNDLPPFAGLPSWSQDLSMQGHQSNQSRTNSLRFV